MKIAVFYEGMSCNLVELYRCFREKFCLHHQGSYTRHAWKGNNGLRPVCWRG